jgi:hypothetical protein
MAAAEPYHFGVDLAQAEDFTAVAMLDREPALDEDGRPARDGQGRPLSRYYCVGLERYERHLSYPALVDRIGATVRLPAVQARGHPMVAVDATGVGRAATDELLAARLPAILTPITITAGMGVIPERWNQAGPMGYKVAKTHLVGSLLAALETGRVKFAPGLKLVPALEAELREFRVNITRAANQTYGAASGCHDDLVIAVALATWLAENVQPVVIRAVVGGRRVPPQYGPQF